MKVMSLEALHNYLKSQHKTFSFSSKETHKPILTYVNGEADELKHDSGLLYARIKVCHTLDNANGSYVSNENMEQGMPSLKYKPVLAHIHQLDDGTYDFHSHDMTINDDGTTTHIEHQVGTITVDEPFLEYDKENDKTYVIAYAVIPEDYTKTADIIREKNGTVVSCEMAIDEMEYNSDTDLLVIKKFMFTGVTLLGSEKDGTRVEEGMHGSRLDIAEFCGEPKDINIQQELLNKLNELNTTLQVFNINKVNDKVKGVWAMDFKEIAEKYGFTLEDIDFDYTTMTLAEFEEELMARCGGGKDDEKAKNAEMKTWICKACGYEAEGEVEPDDCPECGESDWTEKTDEPIDEPVPEENKKRRCGQSANGSYYVSFELSHDDIRYQIYDTMFSIDGMEDCWVCAIYDTYFIASNCNGSFIKQEYTLVDNVVEFNGEPTEVFEMFVTADEKAQLDEMKASYDELKEYKRVSELAASNLQKDTILNSPDFECLAENAEFKKLKREKSKYSAQEVETKAKVIFANHAMASGYSKSTTGALPIMQKIDNKKASIYAGLFE